MRFQPYVPCDRLRPYVKRFVVSEATDEQTYKVLPDTSLVMGFQYRGKLSYVDKTNDIPLAKAGITGLQPSFRLFKNSPAVGSILVVFTETGAASFLNTPVNELFSESVSLDNFVSRSVLSTLDEQLSEATTDQQRIRLVEQFLLSSLQESNPDTLVSMALQHIYRSNGLIRMADLAHTLCISQSPFEKRFRKIVGTSPKKFSSIVRVKHAISLLPTTDNLTDLSLESGYYDQAHFSHEFKLFTGLTPTEFSRNPSSF